MKHIIIIISLFLFVNVFSQTNNIFDQLQDSSKAGVINIYQENNIKEIAIKHRNYIPTTIYGYQIRVFFGRDRDRSYSIKKHFDKRYKKQKTYLTYNSPYYIVKFGKFKNRKDVSDIYKEIKRDYPSASLVRKTFNIKEFDDE